MNKQTEALKQSSYLETIGSLVISKLISHNDIPVSRCVITNDEVASIIEKHLGVKNEQTN